MNKKILIGSIITICILVGVSFTSVVGYNNIESNIGVSPLFNIRSSRAIDEDNKILTSDYVGKGEDINLLIPDRNDDMEKLRRAIEKIQAMDDETFDKFVNLVIYKIQKYNKFKDVNDNGVIIVLNKLRDNSELNNKDYNKEGETWKDTPTLCWFPGCYISSILLGIYQITLGLTLGIMIGMWVTLLVILMGINNINPTFFSTECSCGNPTIAH